MIRHSRAVVALATIETSMAGEEDNRLKPKSSGGAHFEQVAFNLDEACNLPSASIVFG